MIYIDPGSGSMLFQVILATAIGSCLAFQDKIRKIWKKVIPTKNQPNNNN